MANPKNARKSENAHVAWELSAEKNTSIEESTLEVLMDIREWLEEIASLLRAGNKR